MEKGRAEYSGSSYIAANSIRLLPGFTGPSGDTFLGRIGYSEEDALALNNTLEGEFLQESITVTMSVGG